MGLITTAAALLLATGSGASSRKLYTGSWAVEISGGDVAADAMAARHGLVNHGQVSNGRRARLWLVGAGLKLIMLSGSSSWYASTACVAFKASVNCVYSYAL